VGDLNEKVGKGFRLKPTIGLDSLHDVSNKNGSRLINFTSSKDLIKRSIYFP